MENLKIISTSEACPICGNYTKGQYKPSLVQKTTSSAIKEVKGALIGFIAGSIFPGIGNIIGMIVGVIIATLIGDKLDKGIDDFSSAVEDTKQYVFICAKCFHQWTKFVCSGADIYLPEQLICQVREEYINGLKRKRPIISTIIFGLLSAYCIYFTIVAAIDMSHADVFTWTGGIVEGFRFIFSSIMSLIFCIPFLFKWGKIKSLNMEISRSRSQTLDQFKHTHWSLFREYV